MLFAQNRLNGRMGLDGRPIKKLRSKTKYLHQIIMIKRSIRFASVAATAKNEQSKMMKEKKGNIYAHGVHAGSTLEGHAEC